jgi:hypothetical protein
METAAHPHSLFKPRSFGKMFVTLTSSASLWSGVVKTFRCVPLVKREEAADFGLDPKSHNANRIHRSFGHCDAGHLEALCGGDFVSFDLRLPVH